MGIIIVSQDYPPDIGGIQTYTIELARRFYQYSNKLSVIAPQKKLDFKIDKLSPFVTHRISTVNTLLPLTLLPVLPVIVEKEDAKIVFHTQWQTVVSSILTQKWVNHKIVVAVHGRELLFTPFPPHSFMERMYLDQMKRIINHVDHFFPVSNYTRHKLIDLGISKEKITLFNNGTDPTYFRPVDVTDFRKKEIGANRRVILSMARLVKWKGIDTVLYALPRIKKAIPDILYLIVGEGPDRERLEKIVGDLGLENHVRFTGAFRNKKRVFYYNLCDVFVQTSKSEYPDVEGFGIVFLEANACGKPVIGSRTGGIPDAIDEGETGLLVEQSNPHDLAEAVVLLLRNPDYAEVLGKQGRDKVVRKANWDIIGAEMHSKLEEILTQ